MKYTRIFFKFKPLALCLAALAWMVPSQAQSPSDAPAAPAVSYVASAAPGADDPQNGMITLHKRVDEVNLLFIATDKHGKFVRDLNQADFSILDDHKPPQSIANFRRETDLPLELGLLVDTSGSVRGRFDFEQEAAVSFLEHTVRPNFDEAFVMG